MGGLLARVVGGALSGAGSAMVDQAKQAREDALASLKRGQEVEDRNAGFAQQDKTVATQQQGETDRTNLNNQTSRDNTKANNDTSITTTGMNNATSTANTKATIGAEDARQVAGFKHDDGKITSTIQTSDGTVFGITPSGAKPLTDGQGRPLVAGSKTAKVTPQQAQEIAEKQYLAYSGSKDGKTVGGVPVQNADGTPADQGAWIASYTKRVLDGNGTPTPLATGGGLVRSPDSKAAVTPPPEPKAAPPQAAVDMLKKNPGLKADFDQKYGQGAAARALGQ